MRTGVDRLESAATGIRAIIEERFGSVTRPGADNGV
jgi:hypothetical protein